MSDHTHIIETKWREADTLSLEERVWTIEEWLEHTEDLVEMFGEDDSLSTDLLSVSGLVKARRNDIAQEADRLKAILVDRKKVAV